MTNPPPSPRAPLAPMQPLVPRAPLQPMRPLVPGQGRRQLPPPSSYDATEKEYVEHAAAELPLPPPPRPPVGILQPPAGWTGVPPTQLPPPIGRPSGSKTGALVAVAVAVAVALLVALATIGSRSSIHRAPAFAVPSIAVSLPPLSVGDGGAHRPSGAGRHEAAPRRGRTLSLNGTTAGERIRVSFTRWVNNARPKSSFFGPGTGNRYVAAQFRITDTGSAPYVDSPANGARVVDRRGTSYRTVLIVGGLREGKVFDAAVSLPPGRAATGYLVFEVPKDARIDRVRFSENSGFGQTGEWTFSRS